MAVIKGIMSNMKGSVGEVTFRRTGSQTVVSQKVTEVTVTRTEQQMRQRTKWANIVQMWKVLTPELQKAFSNKLEKTSDYNMFMRVNMQRQPVYLTKQQVDGGACVAAPYQLTQGSLPAIVVSGEGQTCRTDIYLGGLSITASTTVAEFSKAVVDGNDTYLYGDQISFFIVRQRVNAGTGIPYVVARSYKVVLDAADADTLWGKVEKNGFSTLEGCLGHSNDDGNCVFAWVHTRKDSGGKLRVSSQTFVNANSVLADYTSDNAFSLASSSYGTQKDVFLSPDGEVTVSTGAGGGASSGTGGVSGGGSDDSL